MTENTLMLIILFIFSKETVEKVTNKHGASKNRNDGRDEVGSVQD